MEWFGRQGAVVFVPITHSPDVDLVVIRDDRVHRVQVKTSGCFIKHRWSVAICTRGGNQSWNGLVSRFSSDRCDLLFVLVADGRRWCIPSEDVEGGRGLILGGPKYERFEIERGLPFDVCAAASQALPAASGNVSRYDSAARRGSEAVKRTGL